MNDEHANGPEAHAALDGHEDPTVVLLRRLTRGEVAAGLRKLAAALGGFRGCLYESARSVDEGSASGLKELTRPEAEDLRDDIGDIVTLMTGVQTALERAAKPGPTEDPAPPADPPIP